MIKIHKFHVKKHYFLKVHILDKPFSLADISTVWTDVKCAINQGGRKASLQMLDQSFEFDTIKKMYGLHSQTESNLHD